VTFELLWGLGILLIYMALAGYVITRRPDPWNR
jgi:hypothetical protein